jgi:acyl-coenzyme A thioesterase PaaI-like protein
VAPDLEAMVRQLRASGIHDLCRGRDHTGLFGEDSEVLTVEYKVNFLAPARGERLVVCGRVLKPGHRITAFAGDVFAVEDGTRTLVEVLESRR